MNARVAAILVVLLVVLGGGALYYHQQERAREPGNVGTLGQPVLPDLRAAEVAAIRLRAPEGALTLEQKDGRWRIAERDGFPADVERVRQFVLAALALKVGQSEPIGEADRARLKLAESGEGMGTVIEWASADGKPLARLIVGKKYFRKAGEENDRAPGDGRFVMRPQDAKTVYVVADPLEQASVQSTRWIERAGIVAERVRTLEVRRPDGSGWKISRSGDNSDWKIEGEVPAGQQLAVTKSNAASYSMSLLELADVAAPGTAPASLGLDKPTVVTATTLDGLTWTLRVGTLANGRYPVQASVEGTLAGERKPEANESAEDKTRRDKEYAERIEKTTAALERMKTIARHVVWIEKIKLEDVLQERSALLEKIEKK